MEKAISNKDKAPLVAAVISALIIFMLGSCLSMRAGHEIGSSRLKFATYSSATNNSIYLEDNKYPLIAQNLSTPLNFGFFDHTYKNKLVVGIDRTVTNLGAITGFLTNNLFKAEIDVQLIHNKLVPSGNAFVVQTFTVTKTFTVTFSGFNAHLNPVPATETDVDSYDYESSYQSLATVTGVRVYNSFAATNSIVTTRVPANIYVELISDAERYYQMNTNLFSFNVGNFSINYLSGISTGNEVELNWSQYPGAEYYDLEWIWLDEYTYGGGTMPSNSHWTSWPVLDFKHNSTRIRTSGNTYRISHLYESGFLFFRIRAVGITQSPQTYVSVGGPLLSEYTTIWSTPDLMLLPSTAAFAPVSAGSPNRGGGYWLMPGANAPYFIDLRNMEHESKKNWVRTSSFAEEGKKQETVEYFDGAQYNRQAVTRNNTDNLATVSETYYDHMGRTAIEAMPTPVQDATIKFYQTTTAQGTAFNFATSGLPFTKDVFTQGTGAGQCAVTQGGFSSQYGTGKYYSPNNPFIAINYYNGFTPHGEDYPFIQKEYTPDHTGKVSRQSAVGAALKIETGAAQKHDTRYLYGSVTQEELDRLFGSEAGYANHYSKRVVIDPNGQVSISYVNSDGKVVATALTGANPLGMDPLLASDGVTNLSQSQNQMNVDLLNKLNQHDPNTPFDNNQLNGDELEFNEKLVVTSTQNYLFNYSLTAGCFQGCTVGQTTFCYDCIYDLEFDIKDKCGNRPPNFNQIKLKLGRIVGTYPNTSNVSNADGIGNNDAVNFSFQQILAQGNNSLTVLLDPGEYTITKKLKVNQSAIDTYLSHYMQNCVQTPAQYTTAEASNMDASGCETDCRECLAKLGTLASYITNNPQLSTQDATDQYNTLVRECNEPCEYNGYCESMIRIMEIDMTPNGQYAEFDGAGSTFNASAYPLSIFNTANKLPRGNTVASWRNPVHYKTSATSYFNENGQPDKVSVFLVAPNTYDPPVVNPGLLVAGNSPNEYLCDPQNLANASDFVKNFKDSWAASLLQYHPEYCYAEWCIKNGNTPGTAVNIWYHLYNSAGTPTGSAFTPIKTSEEFDSLLVTTEDIDDIHPSSYSTLFTPLQSDPYWTTTGAYYVSAASTSPAGLTEPDPAQNVAGSGSIWQRQSTTSAIPADFSATGLHFSQRQNKTANNRYFDYMGSGLKLYQYAAILATPLSMQFGQTPAQQLNALHTTYYTSVPVNPQDYILNIIKPGSPGDDSYKRKAWENFTSLYLSMKQKLQNEVAASYVMNSNCRGCNDCIGNPDFDPKTVAFTTYLSTNLAQLIAANNIGSFPVNLWALTNISNAMPSLVNRDWFQYDPNSGQFALNRDQVCGLATKDLFKTKARRFTSVDESDASGPGNGNSGANIYAQTGLCPNAYDLQNFLNGVKNDMFVTTSNGVNLSNDVPEFSQNLYQAILPVIPNPFQNAYYSMLSTSSNILTASITIGTSNTCQLGLNLPSALPAGLPANANNWAKYDQAQTNPATFTITQFAGLSPQAGANNPFTVVATIAWMTGTTVTTGTILVSGTSCIPLTGCSFAPPCKTNVVGKAVNALLNSFSSNAKFPAPYNGGYQAGSLLTPVITPYSHIFTNSFKPLLELPANAGNSSQNWQWSYSASSGQGTIEIADVNGSSTTNKRLRVVFTLPTSPDISCIQSLHDFYPDQSGSTGAFKVTGVISNIANVTACPNGSIALTGTVYIGTWSTSSHTYAPLDIGGCSFNLISCATPEHETKKDFEKWVTDPASGFRTMITSASALNISSEMFFTGHLRSYFNSATSGNSNGPIQNYYHWLPDAGSTAHELKGWVTISQSPNAPSSPPPGSCKITLKKTTAAGINLNLLTSLGNVFNLSGNTNGSPNDYTALLTGTLGGSPVALELSTTCFPMKACNTCTTTTPGPNVTVTNTVLLENFNSNNSSFSLKWNGTPYTMLSTFNYGGSGYALSNQQAGVGAIGMPFSQTGSGPCLPASFTGNATIPAWAQPFLHGNSVLLFHPNDPTCSNGNVTSIERSFTPPVTGNYDINFLMIGYHAAGWPSCERLKIFVNNTQVYNNACYTKHMQANQVVPLTGGTSYMIKFEITHQLSPMVDAGLRAIMPIFITYQTTHPTQIPCVSTADQWPTDTMPTVEYEEPCAEYLQDVVDNSADEKFDAYLDSAKANFIRNYKKHCINSAIENLAMRYSNSDYHFTLYYYDQAGNLTRTIPPEGVNVINLAANFQPGLTNGAAIKLDRSQYTNPSYQKKVYTKHKFQTTSSFNSLNQLLSKTSPDAGKSIYFYDNGGRQVASQSAEQAVQSSGSNFRYNYTKFDVQGRVVEVGALGTHNLNAYPAIPAGQTIRDVLSAPNYPQNLIIAPGSQMYVSKTYYGDRAGFFNLINVTNFSNGRQEGVRGRIASITMEEVYDGNDNTYDHGTHFSYDSQGNSKEILIEDRDLALYTGQKVKRLQYTYDVLTGKPKSTVYQRGKRDMLAHKFYYDALNRLTTVHTSRDSMLWDQDAKYYYYLHGKLARIELGEYKVAGNDYVYTLQGWTKGMNSDRLVPDNDIGKDGYGNLTAVNGTYDRHRFVGRDAYGFTARYFSGSGAGPNDYLPVNGAHTSQQTYFLAGITGAPSAINRLYTGNISALSTSYLNPNPIPITLTNISPPTTVNKYDPYCFLKTYKYDQRNRLIQTQASAKAVLSTNIWNFSTSGQEYAERFLYDQNGNMTSVSRDLASGPVDDLKYWYYDANGNFYDPTAPPPTVQPTNKLSHISDNVGPSTMGDLGMQPLNNYAYDASGHLTKDLSEGIQSIRWTPFGKVQEVQKNNGSPKIRFKYDAFGNRISKTLFLANGSKRVTYYVRDGQGNLFSTYEEQSYMSGANAIRELRLTEQMVMGVDLLGLATRNELIGYLYNGLNANNGLLASGLDHNRVLGNKSYELSNHLGNVNAVISDRILPVDALSDGTADYLLPEVTSSSDNYAFGALMHDRNFSAGSYMFGFNGMEKDDEIKGAGNSLDFGARMYDSRVGRFMSLDPMTSMAPEQTPYGFASNSPVAAVDKNGEFTFFFAGAVDGQDPDPPKNPRTVGQDLDATYTKLLGPDHYSRVKSAENPKLLDKGKWTWDNGFKPMADPMSDPLVKACVDEILLKFNEAKAKNPDEQLNFIGSSYGSVLAAQIALALVKQGVPVRSIILTASPVSEDSELGQAVKALEANGTTVSFQHNDPRFDASAGSFKSNKTNYIIQSKKNPLKYVGHLTNMFKKKRVDNFVAATVAQGTEGAEAQERAQKELEERQKKRDKWKFWKR